MKKVLCFFGTRPEAIKMAPVVKCLKASPHFRVIVAVSAQHRQMLDQALALFRLKSHIDLDLMQEGQSLFDITTKVINRFEEVLKRVRPDLVLVHGDTTTTLGGSLAAYYEKIPVGHVEAGLRTQDRYRPFPEEMNRRLTDALATLYFAPTTESRRNLLKENLSGGSIFVTGNTVIDALLHTVKLKRSIESGPLKRALERIQQEKASLILMTAHRRENFGAPYHDICRAVVELSRNFPRIHWIYPVHPNPNVKKPAHRWLSGRRNIHLIPPVNYYDLTHLINRSRLVVTDSGGLQEEAPSLGKPVLVLREVTERPEAVRAGTVRIIGMTQKRIVREVSWLLTDPGHYRRMANAVNPYGDGRAAERIVKAIEWFFGFRREKPTPFRSPS
ncbi:MAG: UDP-N-acetylglucosamine 2-epimerase (non-hydrolyzing) [Elusimicrobia bacterium]|nr:UDP-N-acetylglucosamine 2-epimerase (non-hydrolyzing) [Candidatus Obscuribacterium magneticum]